MMSVALWDLIYFRIGSEDKIEELLIRFRDLVEESEYPGRVQVLQGELGTKNNLFILGFSGTDLSDLWSGYQKLFEVTVPVSGDIFNKLIFESTEREQRTFFTRLDLIKRINQD